MEASPATPAPSARAVEPTQADWLRMLGGVVFAVGALIFYVRRSGGAPGVDEWADFPLLLVIGIPFVLLYGLGVAGRRAEGGPPESWRSVLMVTGVVLAPIALSQLRDTLGLSEASSFWTFCIFAGTAALAAYASFVVGAAYQALLAGLAGIVAWLALWDWILADPSVNAFRWLLVVLAVGYVAWAVSLRTADAPQASEVITAAGVTGVLVGTIGVIDAGAQALGGLAIGLPPGDGDGGQGFFWDLVLLLVSLALVAYAGLSRVRGPAYVGFVGLVAFAALMGVEINSLLEGEQPDGSFVGWPLVLIAAGAVALAAGVAQRE